MNKKAIHLVLIITGALLFNLVFWQEKLGINTILFDSFLLSAIFYLYAEARQSAAVRWLLLGHLTCLAMIVLHNTMLSKLAFMITLALITAFAMYRHRSALFAGGSVLMNIVCLLDSMIRECGFSNKKERKRSRRIGMLIRFAVVPVFLLSIFFVIYFFSNSVFQEIADAIGSKLQYFFTSLLSVFSWERVLFMFLGLYITGVVLLRSRVHYFSKRDTLYKDDLQRTRLPWRERVRRPFYNLLETIMGRLVSGMMALKNENMTGLISLGLLNLLLLGINIIDIDFLWLHFNYNGDVKLYKLVHEGTELLIVSIVLAILVLLFFFKGNLNFYKRNKWLKYGAYLWIIQNTVLVISVFLRDYYYIVHYGLAYKRIGVLFFLLMVLIGLITVFIKIWQKKTVYFLFRVNAWAGVTVLVLASCVHWDEFIAGYNLQRQDEVPLDIAFLMSLSDKTIPLLEKNSDSLQKKELELKNAKQDLVSIFNDGICKTCYLEKLAQRERMFIHRQQQYSWLSWNFADDYVKKYLRNKQLYPPAPGQKPFN